MAEDPQEQGTGGPPGAGNAPAPPPEAKPGFSLARLWSSIGLLPKIVGGTVAVLAGLATLYGTYLRPVLPARLSLRASCQNSQINLEIANSGGRTARLGLPRFTIHSSERPNDPLDLRRYLKDPPVGDRIDVPSDGRHPLEYNNPLDFFGKEESANNACRFEIKIPVEGRTEPLSGTCPCTYIEH